MFFLFLFIIVSCYLAVFFMTVVLNLVQINLTLNEEKGTLEGKEI